MSQEYAKQMADIIIRELKSGAKAWRQNWRVTLSNRPINGTTFRCYRGYNYFRLVLKMQEKGWTDPRFYTEKQLEKLGAHARWDEEPTIVRYCNSSGFLTAFIRGYKPTGGPFVVRYSEVYNAEQCEGVPEMPKTYEMEWETYETAEQVLQSSGVEILYDQTNAQFYDWSEDKIHMTPRENFPKADDFYCTALHELAHATGHESRLKRKIKGGFGSEDYAKEELRAEIASMMMCSKLGIQTGEMTEHQLAYIGHWIKTLENHPMEIVKACNAAERICQWLFSRVEDKDKLNLYDSLLIVRKVPRAKKVKEFGPIIRQNEFRPLEDVKEEKARLYDRDQAKEQERLLRLKLTPQEIKERIQLLKNGEATLGVDHREAL